MGLARPGNLLEGRGGWPSFKFGPPLLGAPERCSCLLSTLARLSRGAELPGMCPVAGERVGGGGLRAWAVVIEGVAFVPTTFLSSGMCRSSDALCLDIFNKGYNCFVGSGG